MRFWPRVEGKTAERLDASGNITILNRKHHHLEYESPFLEGKSWNITVLNRKTLEKPPFWMGTPMEHRHFDRENNGKSLFWMGKLTVSMAMFNSKLLNYQRVVGVYVAYVVCSSILAAIAHVNLQSLRVRSSLSQVSGVRGLWYHWHHEKTLCQWYVISCDIIDIIYRIHHCNDMRWKNVAWSLVGTQRFTYRSCRWNRYSSTCGSTVWWAIPTLTANILLQWGHEVLVDVDISMLMMIFRQF